MAEQEQGFNPALLLQYMSAASNDIGSGNPLGANVNKVTQQTIQARNMMGMLQKLLSNGGKMTADAQNISFKAPVSAFSAAGGPGTATPLAAPQEGIGLRDESGNTGVPSGVNQVTPTRQSGTAFNTNMLAQLFSAGGGGVNPSASPLGDFSNADLAGLTTQDISQALQFKLGQEEAVRREMLDTAKDLTAQRRLDIEEGKTRDTSDIRNYQYALAQGYKGSFDEFRNSTASAGIKEYQLAKDEGYTGSFFDWKTELAKAQKTDININTEGKLDFERQRAEQASRIRLESGDIHKDIDAALKSEDFLNKTMRFKPGSYEYKKAVEDTKAAIINRAINDGRGQINKAKSKYNEQTGEIVIVVKWPNGDERSYKYDLRK